MAAIEYHEQVLPEYRGSPLIEALPEIMSSEDVLRELRGKVTYSQTDRELPAKFRIHCLARLAHEFYQPLPQHFDIESRISVCIRQGYLNRNPVKAEYAALANEGYAAAAEKRPVRKIPGYHPHASGFTIIGVSGVGKSTAVESVLNLYPQVIEHKEYKGKPLPITQLVWLKLDCPHDGSLGGLCYSFFETVDTILGTHYYDEFKKSRVTIDSMMTSMVRIAHEYSLGVLCIDEIQHLSVAGGRSDAMLNFFVTLVNTIGVPVILIGTSKAMPILQGEFRQARRGSGHGDLVWNRMNQDDEEWQLLVDSMWEYQWTKQEVLLTPEIKEVIYKETQGIVVLAVVLYILVQEDAILSERESFGAADITRVAKQRMVLVQPMLEALRKNDQKKIEQYADITTILVDQFSSENWKAHVAAIPDKKPAPSKALNELRSTLLSPLWNMGIPPEQAEEIIEKVYQSSKSKDIREMTRAIWASIPLDQSGSETGNTEGEEPDADDLRLKGDYEAIARDGSLEGDDW